jgi:hypothetical protein
MPRQETPHNPRFRSAGPRSSGADGMNYPVVSMT